MQFAIVKKGFDPRAVEEYIAVSAKEHQDQLDTAKKRNALLSEEIEDLHRQLDELRRNESRVSRLLVDIQALADKTEQTVRQYAAAEQERLTLFRDKWVDYATRYLHQNLTDFADKLDQYAYDYAHRVQQNLSENLFLMSDPLWADYQAEQARTRDASDTPIHIEDLLARLQKKDV
jgi:ABC-type transporter Mla subunit MlaD